MNDIIERLRSAENKGPLLELVVQDALGDNGFENIRRQYSGSQYGFDVSAQRKSPLDGRSELWVFECKNLSTPITVSEIAPKLAWHQGKAKIDRFVVVGTTTISNDLDRLLQEHQYPIQIGVWTENTLEALIRSSVRAMERLGLAADASIQTFDLEGPFYYPSHSVRLVVEHQLNPPFAFDYLSLNQSYVKAVNDFQLRLLATVSNPMRSDLRINSFCAVTLGYETVEGRIVRLMKQKGIFTPIKLSFIPSINVGGTSDILKGRVWTVNGGSSETVALVLSKRTLPGLYQIAFRLDGDLDGKPITRLSPALAVHVLQDGANVLRLYVLNRHYDSPALQLLDIDEPTWQRLKREAEDVTKMVFIGPTYREIMVNQIDENWIVRSCPVDIQRDGRGRINPANSSSILLDLKSKVDEEIFSLDDVMTRVTGTDKWFELVKRTLEQQRNEPITY